ncbi:MAG: glycosyltransferase family protein [Acidobacteriota bacterium]
MGTIKILYGVVGEGMGHAMRSRVVLEHLLAQGHEIEIMASSRGADFLAARFRGVRRIHGFHIVYEENRMKLAATVRSNVVSTAATLPANVSAYFELVDQFEPEVVVSDFESWTYLYGKLHDLPVISVDNNQMLSRCDHPPEVTRPVLDFRLAQLFVRGKLPFCHHYVVSTFFFPGACKRRTTLVPPILRPEILAARSTPGDHLLVYQTAEGNTGLARTLAGTGMECRIYGMRRGIQEEQVEGNLRYRPFDEAGFIADLASARAVIGGGSFTVMGEAVYLRKPMLSVPVGGQFEQVLNARWLERLGYGRHAESLADPEVVHRFLNAVPACEDRLASYEQDGNRKLQETLDGLLAEL